MGLMVLMSIPRHTKQTQVLMYYCTRGLIWGEGGGGRGGGGCGSGEGSDRPIAKYMQSPTESYIEGLLINIPSC